MLSVVSKYETNLLFRIILSNTINVVFYVIIKTKKGVVIAGLTRNLLLKAFMFIGRCWIKFSM